MFQHHITDIHLDVRVGPCSIVHISSLAYTLTPKMDSVASRYIGYRTRSNVIYGRVGEYRSCRRWFRSFVLLKE